MDFISPFLYEVEKQTAQPGYDPGTFDPQSRILSKIIEVFVLF